MLDIVTHSIYTDKEVFLRELISNASDAMEKLRHLQVVGEAVEEGAAPLEITVTTDEKEKTLTVQDTVRWTQAPPRTPTQSTPPIPEEDRDGDRENYTEKRGQ